MCWFTLTPTKGKKKHHHHGSSDSSCAEEIVRVHHDSSPRFSDVSVKVPGSIASDLLDDHHHHHHPHLHPHLHPQLHHHHRHHIHPLHLHPIHGHHHHHHHPHLHTPTIKLRGPGRKRCPPGPGPAPPPPTRDPSRCRPTPRSRCSSPARPPREPIYRTQVVEPVQVQAAVRETTRGALRSVQAVASRPRGRLRRVAGYEVLGKDVPWNWDCVSSSAGSNTGGGKWVRKRGTSGGGHLRYPPYGSIDKWL